MYSSNDRYYAAKLAAERREIMMQRTMRSSRCEETCVGVASMPRTFGSTASLAPLSSLIPLMLIALTLSLLVIIILSSLLIPLGL